MRPLSALLCVTFLVACGSGEEAAEEPAGPTLADFAGTWQVTSMMEGVEEPVRTSMTGSEDGSEWTMTLEEGREPMAIEVSIMGDSLIGQTPEYESILREGVMVSVRTAAVMVDGTLEGTLVATYRLPDGEEVVPGTFTASRMEQ